MAFFLYYSKKEDDNIKKIQPGDYIWRCVQDRIDEFTTRNTVSYFIVLSIEKNNLTITSFVPPISEWHKVYDYDDLRGLYNIEIVIAYKRPIFQKLDSSFIAERWRTLAYEWRWGDNGRVLFPYEDHTRSNPLKSKEWLVECHPELIEQAVKLADEDPFWEYKSKLKEKEIESKL